MPEQESRIKKTLLNARVNLIFYFLTLCLSFFSRKIFLDCLGADFIGLTGTLQNLLGFLNLAELGIGSAIGYVLYKPLFDHDQTKINEIISVMGYLYRWIGLVILVGGIILSLFLPFIFPNCDTSFHLPLIYFTYFSFLGSSLIGYFINYRQNLLGADQRNYVVTAYFQSANIIKTLIQMAVAYYTANLYIWIAIEFTFGIIYSFILNWKINQTYPWLQTEVNRGRDILKKYPLIIKNTKKIFLHKIGIVTQFQAAPILIYSFTSLQIVAFYTNYTILIDKISLLFNNFLGGSEASVGNLIAEGNRAKILNVFWELMSLRFWLCGVTFFALYMLMDPFIQLWLGPEYVLSRVTLILVIINYAIPMVQNTIGQFTYGYGLFNDVWATITSAIIYVFFAIILGYFYGLRGVLIASIISLIFLYLIWKPYFLYRYGFKIHVVYFWFNWIKYLLIILCCFVGAVLMCNSIYPYVSIENQILRFVAISIISLVIYFCISIVGMCLFFKSFRFLLSRIKFINNYK